MLKFSIYLNRRVFVMNNPTLFLSEHKIWVPVHLAADVFSSHVKFWNYFRLKVTLFYAYYVTDYPCFRGLAVKSLCRLLANCSGKMKRLRNTVFYLITAHIPMSTQSSNSVVFRLHPVYFLSTSLYRHMLQFKRVHTKYAFIKKIRKKIKHRISITWCVLRWFFFKVSP